jgi:4-amino-4-deoxy-L-arabinose transferase-like glycosyltransferase
MPKVPFWIFIVLAILYFMAVRVDTMDVDASQYAEMSREMLHSHNYLQVYDRGAEYLDKPPFLFWVSAASMALFGVNNFGYKLPSILFALWALFVTYKLGKRLYNDATGRMAALILGSCQGMFLMTNDVRCDTILLSWVITATWLIKEWQIQRKLYLLLLGATAIAFGMMTKGPIALMVPVFCFAADWALKRDWKMFLKWEYLLAILVIAILLIPMSVGLYQQFDLRPEKLVNNATDVSGLRFFYWTQSFGRITGQSPWQNGADFSFLIVNMLWSFLPWIFLFLPALTISIIELVKQKFKLQPQQEWVSTGGFLLAYISLGSSRYQLPHYIFVAFPLAAIATAKLLKDLFDGFQYRKLHTILRQYMHYISALLFLASLLVVTFVFFSVWGIVMWSICFLIWLKIATTRREINGRLFWVCSSAIILANIIMTNFFYYPLLQYQVGSQVGRYMHTNHISNDDFIAYKIPDGLIALPFYAQEVTHRTDSIKGLGNKKYILTSDEGVATLAELRYNIDTLKEGIYFKVSELTGQFINPATRGRETHNYYLVKVK